MIAGASPTPLWLDRPRPAEAPPLEGMSRPTWRIVGAGFTGLWAAVMAKQERPDREVVVLEAAAAGFGGSGRNGGFVDASLTHGLLNGMARFPQELEALEALGRENLEGMRDDVARLRIDASWSETGMLSVATAPHELAELGEEAAALRRYGWDAEVLDREEVRALVASPTYLGPSTSAPAWRSPIPERSPSGCAARARAGRAAVRAHAASRARRLPSWSRRAAACARSGCSSPPAPTSR